MTPKYPIEIVVYHLKRAPVEIPVTRGDVHMPTAEPVRYISKNFGEDIVIVPAEKRGYGSRGEELKPAKGSLVNRSI